MKHTGQKEIRLAVREMQKTAIGQALYCAKNPQDYSSAKRIGVIPWQSAKQSTE